MERRVVFRCSLDLIFVAVIDTMTESNLGRKGFITAHSCGSITKGSQGRNLEAGTETEAMEEHCSLGCFSLLAQPALLSNPGPLAKR